MLLIGSLLFGGLDVVFPDTGVLKYLGTLASLLGLMLVITAATLVMKENRSLQQALDNELEDLPDLAAKEQVDPTQAGRDRMPTRNAMR